MNSERSPAHVPASVQVGMEQEAQKWPGAGQKPRAGTGFGSLSSLATAREVLLLTFLILVHFTHIRTG